MLTRYIAPAEPHPAAPLAAAAQPAAATSAPSNAAVGLVPPPAEPATAAEWPTRATTEKELISYVMSNIDASDAKTFYQLAGAEDPMQAFRSRHRKLLARLHPDHATEVSAPIAFAALQDKKSDFEQQLRQMTDASRHPPVSGFVPRQEVPLHPMRSRSSRKTRGAAAAR
jgi:hypothetical protein